MKYGKLTMAEWAENAKELEQIKKVLLRWLKQIPKEAFETCCDAPWFASNARAWQYKPRYLKSCFLRELHSAKHICEIPKIIELLLRFSEEVLVVFLCSKLSATHAEITRALIDYVENDDQAERLECNYKFIVKYGIRNIAHCTFGDAPLFLINKFHSVTAENRLYEPENYFLLDLLSPVLPSSGYSS